MKFPLMSKAMALGAVTLGLMWALGTVQSLVQERQSRMEEAQNTVANSLASQQTLLGPVLARNCSETWIAGYSEAPERKPQVETRTWQLRQAPAHQQAQAQVKMVPRYKGLFKVNTYSTHVSLDARWGKLTELQPRALHPQGTLTCGRVFLSVAVTDARGIQQALLQAQNKTLPVMPGSGLLQTPVGFQAELSDDVLSQTDPLNVTVALDLSGTASLSMAPLADTHLVQISANWPHPNFGGRFLPTERQISEQGFQATWKVSALASTAQTHWQRGAGLCPVLSDKDPVVYQRPANSEGAGEHVPCIETFGVEFVDPVNPYVLNDRASKYGLLFIVLTLVGVGLVEALSRLRVHPVQYLLVGAALAVFFLLLLSLSEHLTFAWAYVAASAACTLLLTFYGSFVLRGAWAGMGFGAGVTCLFGTLYVLLQMEQTALVLGSVLIFLVLAGVMFATRKLDWYALMAQMRQQSDASLQEPGQ